MYYVLTERVEIRDTTEVALSIQAIKEACIIHYKEHGKKCDILIGERGPPVKNISKLPR